MRLVDMVDNLKTERDVIATLRAVDLNLLVVLDALSSEGNVTRAGRRLGLSQSATSGALGRLRTLFEDPLFVRTADGIEPTPRTQMLIPPVREALSQLKIVLERPSFEPDQSTRTFRVALSDYASIALLATTLDNLNCDAPATTLNVVSTSSHDATEVLGAEVELAVGVFRDSPPSIRHQRLWTSGWRYLVRQDHPFAERPVTADRYAKLGHVLVSPAGKRTGAIDGFLAKVGRARSVEMVVPDWTIGAMLVAKTDLVLSGPDVVIDALADILGLVSRPLPRSIPSRIEVDAVWHRRYDEDPGHIFLRKLLQRTSRDVTA